MRSGYRAGGLVLYLLPSVALFACGQAPPLGPSLERTPCRLDGLGVEAQCSNYPVFENRQTRQGRTLTLRVAVVPALAASPRPDPLFILVGGPGQAATEAGARVAEALRDVRRTRDIVLVDQRGTGKSHPLKCDDENSTLAKRFAPALDLGETRACLRGLDADTTQYATPAAMDDLDDVRRALGYSRINLWGGSYGTRAALVYLRQHPDHVRSLILDGVAPTQIELPSFVPRDAQRALDLSFEDCASDPDCKAAFPDAEPRLMALLGQLGSEAHSLSIAHPRRGVAESLRIERDGLSSVLLNLLYVPELAALIPLGVERASHGDYAALIAAAEAFSDGVGVSSGMFLSVVCAEDVPRISAEEAAERSHDSFLGGAWLDRLRAECAEWPSAELPEAYFAPILSDTPSLVLSGNLDPVTPPSWGAQVAGQLSHSRHVVVPGVGHGVSMLGCVPDLIGDFLDSLDPDGLDTACVERLHRPAFFTSLMGPSP